MCEFSVNFSHCVACQSVRHSYVYHQIYLLGMILCIRDIQVGVPRSIFWTEIQVIYFWILTKKLVFTTKFLTFIVWIQWEFYVDIGGLAQRCYLWFVFVPVLFYQLFRRGLVKKKLMQIAHYRKPLRVTRCRNTDIYWGSP